MDNKELLEQEWDRIRQKVIAPLWTMKYSGMYLSLKLDYDDFVSLAGFELTKAIPLFDDTKSTLLTFATNVISQKAKSELRNCGTTSKRSGFYKAVSIDTPIGNNEETTLGDTLVAKEDDEVSVLTQRYLDGLTKMQRKVAELFMDGYTNNEIKEMLGLTNDRFNLIMMNMCESRKLAPLRKVKERMRV